MRNGRWMLSAAAALTALAALAAAASAQAAPPVAVGIAGGYAGFNRSGGTGALLALDVEGRTPVPGLRLRAEGLYGRWGAGRGGIGALTGNAALGPGRWRVGPYLVGGAGAYAPQGTGVRAGWNAGVGVRAVAGRARVFAEYRGHHYAQSGAGAALFSPLTVGVHF